MSLSERIELALQQAGLTPRALADEIGITRQSIYRLSHTPTATLKAANLAHASRVLKCDLYWLCTGEGSPYVPLADTAAFSFLALEAARLMDTMDEPTRQRAFSLVYELANGNGHQGRAGHAGPVPAPLPPPRPRKK